jgi:quinol-cytochrome oxidoreductase complex cytochrome b subunit
LISKFFLHLFPKKFYKDTLKFSKTLYAGIISTALFVTLAVTGFLLMFYYSPETSMSYKSIIFLEEKVFSGAFIRAVHRMASHGILIFSALHLLRTVFTGSYASRGKNWKLGYIVFCLIIFEAYTGYLMPMDQLAYWATVTGMELMNTLPAGEIIKQILIPDDVGGRLTMLRFFTLHIVLIPSLLVMLISAHLYNIRRDGGLVKYSTTEKSDNNKRLINTSLIIGIAVIIVTSVLAYIIKAPLDIAADPASPPNPAWFLLWIQEVVSWKAFYFNFTVILMAAYYFLPNYRKNFSPDRSKWFSKEDMPVWITTAILTITIIVLTVIAVYFRGENWEFGLFLQQ